jgi:hypothetical protein
VTTSAERAVQQFDRVASLLDDACQFATENPSALWESLDRAHGAVALLASLTGLSDGRDAVLQAGLRAQQSHERLVRTLKAEQERIRRAMARVGAGSLATTRYGQTAKARRRMDRSA